MYTSTSTCTSLAHVSTVASFTDSEFVSALPMCLPICAIVLSFLCVSPSLVSVHYHVSLFVSLFFHSAGVGFPLSRFRWGAMRVLSILSLAMPLPQCYLSTSQEWPRANIVCCALSCMFLVFVASSIESKVQCFLSTSRRCKRKPAFQSMPRKWLPLSVMVLLNRCVRSEIYVATHTSPK